MVNKTKELEDNNNPTKNDKKDSRVIVNLYITHNILQICSMMN